MKVNLTVAPGRTRVDGGRLELDFAVRRDVTCWSTILRWARSALGACVDLEVVGVGGRRSAG